MSKKSLKIVTIGGGSSYTPELVEGFIKRYDHLELICEHLIEYSKAPLSFDQHQIHFNFSIVVAL